MARTKQIISSGFRMVVDVPYASYLNEGTEKMVKRQFVGQTAELTAQQKVKINEVISEIWKS